MNPPSKTYRWASALALIWNLIGVAAIAATLLATPADRAAWPAAEQALHQARPLWSVAGSVLAVGAGTLGCWGLLRRRRWSLPWLAASLLGIGLQDVGLALAQRAAGVGPLPTAVLVLQGLVLVIGLALLSMGRRAAQRGWLR